MRLIDADNAIHALGVFSDMEHGNKHFLYGIESAKEIIAECETIDAVSVVQCKDCKHYNTTGCSKGFGWCENIDRGVSDNFYCANGAKMEDKP
jgi:hypothetical protein